jgi:hypothetical protein
LKTKKAIALNGITFYHTQGHTVVTEGCSITFQMYEQMELYIQERKEYWSKLLNLELTISPDNNETLLEKDIDRVLKLACGRLGVGYESAKTRYQGGPEVKARRMTIAICINRSVEPVSIRNVLGLDHSTISYHIKTNINLCETNTLYRSLFLEVEDHVMSEIGGRFMEDGSGKKATI